MNDDQASEGEQTNTPLNAEARAEFSYVKSMRGAGVPIDGFGEQAHLLARNFLEGSGTPAQNIEANIAAYKKQLADLIGLYRGIGAKFYVTELDVNVGGLPVDWTPQQKEGLKARLFAAVYETALDSGWCDTVVSMGFTNASSWVLAGQYPYEPGESPLPFDNSYRPTMSQFEIQKVLLAHRG
jgi:GH35 family endo-1,4-beta-xylanase